MSLVGRSAPYGVRYAFHTFELFDLRVCGEGLLGNYSSHWTAMVDTGAACLSLPQVCVCVCVCVYAILVRKSSIIFLLIRLY